MRILGQKMMDGSVVIVDAPSPQLPKRFVRVRSLFSAISPGTEGGKIVAGKQSLLAKASSKPQQTKQVIDMYRSLGFKTTYRKVMSKLEGIQPLGYSLSGIVLEVGAGIDHLNPGDLVACAGGGYANHADEVVIPVNLVAKVPAAVTPDSAAFATLGAIAIQGVRLAELSVGDCVVVIGLGIVGQLTCQLCKASGCRTLGIDISKFAAELAAKTGSADEAITIPEDNAEAIVADFSRGRGVDAVLVCAGTDSKEPFHLATKLIRKKGKIVVPGRVGIEMEWSEVYMKEPSVSISCSYGPGRYDPSYEEKGIDYPYEFVRWTEGRNMEAFLDMIALGSVDPLALVTHRTPFDNSPEVYELIATKAEPFCGILIEYENDHKPLSVVRLAQTNKRKPEGSIGISFYGPASFAQTSLLPPIKSNNHYHLRMIATGSGITATDVGNRYGFQEAVGSLEQILEDSDTDAVFIATRHDLHAKGVIAALKAGKHVFVEKPLCILPEELKEIDELVAKLKKNGEMPILQVGYNRRFSSAAIKGKKFLGKQSAPYTMMYRINAGSMPRDHWMQDMEIGGGRLIGEGCHFMDLMQYFCDSNPSEINTHRISVGYDAVLPMDNTITSITFEDGSVGSLGYFSEGPRSLPKERFEVIGNERSVVIDNFQNLECYGKRKTKNRVSGKGHDQEIVAFADAIRSGISPIPEDSLIATSAAMFKIMGMS